MADEATTHADLYGRHEPDPENWDEAEAVTGRPVDKPTGNSTLRERAKARRVKVIDQAENKAVQSSEAKAPAKSARKSSK